MEVDKYEPDYDIDCVVCGSAPTVTVTRRGKKIHETYMCGVYSWGEAAMVDPEEWNE